MTGHVPPAYPESEIESLLCALAGVLAASVVTDQLGRLEEIHILADARGHPKQIVRNVESALCAGLGIGVDRRLISVAQVRADGELQTPADQPDPDAEHPSAADDATGRFILLGYEARHQPDSEAACRATIGRGSHTFVGNGAGPSTIHGRAAAGARALFDALTAARGNIDIGLDGVCIVEANGRPFVLVTGHALEGREAAALTGVAAVIRSPEEAAILAALQATNRWIGHDG